VTRPRNRPVGGRYYVVVGADGMARDVGTGTSDIIGRTLPDERIVECVAMPSVTVRQTAGGWTGDFYAVFVNGTRVGEAMFDDAARDFARDLRRALRGK